ncbi:hypothetical protein [Hymenobacter koreensis]
MKVTRFHLAAFLLVLLITMLQLSGPARAQSLPDPGSAAGRATSLARYYNHSLRLQPHQYKPVFRATLQQVQAMDSLQLHGVVSAASLHQIEEDFVAHVQPCLTASQLSALLTMRTQQPQERIAPAVVSSIR